MYRIYPKEIILPENHFSHREIISTKNVEQKRMERDCSNFPRTILNPHQQGASHYRKIKTIQIKKKSNNIKEDSPNPKG
jgi:hypothetical protein